MDEQRAIQQMRQGHIKGLEGIVAKYQDRAVKAAFLIIQDRGQAEDIVQASFLKAYQRIDQYDSQRPFGPWFLRIVANDAVKHVTRQREITLKTQEAAFEDLLPDEAFSPEQQLEQKERRQLIWQALKQLSPEQRAVVVMRYFLDVDENDIAAQLNTPSGTIRWRLYAARQQLRHLLSPFFKFGLSRDS